MSGALAARRTAPDPTPLLIPRSVAIVGATERPGAYGDTVLRNLAAARFEGSVWGVNPGREEVHGRPCVASVAELPEPVDAVVVAIPAAGVAAVLAEAIERSCGGAIVISAGFGEIEAGVAMERELAEVALAGGLPVCGPNCDGIVSVRSRAALWGDSVEQLREGGVALISQSGNIAVNALGVRRGIGFHTVVSTGNQAVLAAGDWIEAVAGLDGVRSIALFLEEDGDGACFARALARCAEREIGVAVLKVGSSEAGARAAGAHTGAVAGDQRIFSALLAEAGAAEARDPQELLELARCLAHSRRRHAAGGPGGAAVLTCSGGDSGLAADLAEIEGLPLPELAPETRRRLDELLPDAATVGNPLDYTTMLWDETEVLESVVEAVGSDPGVDQLLLLFDEPDGLSDTAKAGWDAVRGALLAGAERAGAEPMLASTVPDLLPEKSALELAERGIAAAAGLREGIRSAIALRTPPASPERLQQIAAAAESGEEGGGTGTWLGEAESKRLLADAGLPVPKFGVASGADAAVALATEIDGPVAVKLSVAGLRHKSEAGALALGLESAAEVRDAAERLLALPEAEGADLLVEAMAAGGVELILAARRDGVVPALVVGLGGLWTEALDDVEIVPLPASPARVEEALGALRGAAILHGRGAAPLDVAAAARFASRLGELLFEQSLDLIEVNPALLGERGCVAVDALARRRA